MFRFERYSILLHVLLATAAYFAIAGMRHTVIRRAFALNHNSSKADRYSRSETDSYGHLCVGLILEPGLPVREPGWCCQNARGVRSGKKQNPICHSLSDHSETVKVGFDPSKISYSELFRVFWTSHDPTYQSWSRQYAFIILVYNDEQRREAQETKAEVERERRRKVLMEIDAYSGFTPAETIIRNTATSVPRILPRARPD